MGTPELAPQPAGAPPEPDGESRLKRFSRAGGGVVAPVVTTIVAFLIGGLVVALTGGDPFRAYRAIYEGTGLQWFLPWTTDREISSVNLQQTLINTVPLILTGLAVAYAFRAGLFNIGGQGQYTVGTVMAVWVGTSFDGMASWLHIVLAVLAATLGGAAWAAIAGVLRATVGANEVISTIMLNYIALWIGVFLMGVGGPLQNTDPGQSSVPVSDPIAASAHLPIFWGAEGFRGLHIGLFIALAAALAFWVLLNRSTKGFEARAVGYNPDAARYAGMGVGRTYVLVMAVCGAFAGLAGSMDILGWQYSLGANDIQISQIGFLGIAVALLGRNTAVGTVFAALLFGALLQGTSVRNLQPEDFDPFLAGSLTTIIQGLVVLVVALDARRLVGMLPRRRRTAGATVTPETGA